MAQQFTEQFQIALTEENGWTQARIEGKATTHFVNAANTRYTIYCVDGRVYNALTSTHVTLYMA